MKLRFLTLLLTFVLTTSFTSLNTNIPVEEFTVSEVNSEEDDIITLYETFVNNNETMPQLVSFTKAVTGYYKLKSEGKVENETLTIIDFSLSSKAKRLWVLDMTTNKVLFNTVVAHGKNTGGEFATQFSNKNNSNQSSLGFYITDNTYYGKNGLSLFLDGQEKGFNDNARKRYVVFHGAKYANPDFAKRHGRLGRSLGCPAVPTAYNTAIINKIKNKSCLFIYHPNKTYHATSKLVS
ncbi:MAG: murein L,D-transpeptidase catalytic domain family protein [Flavobacteriaceae bacterium]